MVIQDLMIVGEEEILIKNLYYVLMKAHCGNVRECRTLIKHHHVYVNDCLVDDPSYQVCKNDCIKVNHDYIEWPFVYYMLNKPKGYLSATYDKNEHYVLEFIDRNDCFCLGRLDKDTTGLLILTNDSSFQSLLLPKNHIDKTYLVEVDYCLDKSLIDLFKKGILIDKNYLCHPAFIEMIDDYHCYITMNEGKYHQVKKMFLSCGYNVLNLKRVSFGNVMLDETLKEGEYRLLKDEEFQKLEKHMICCRRGI